MSNTPLWGTGIASPERSLRRRGTSTGDTRVTSAGDLRVAYIPPDQIKYIRVTDTGDVRYTSAGDRRVVIVGLAGPAYYQTADVTQDGDENFSFYYETNPWQPDAQGGECVFQWCFLAVSWSMAATLRITPVVDADDVVETVPDGELEVIRSTFVLDQQDGTLQRKNRVLAIPIARALLRNDVEVARFYLRGQRLSLIVESTGPLGVGELMFTGNQVQFSPVRKAAYPGAVVAE